MLSEHFTVTVVDNGLQDTLLVIQRTWPFYYYFKARGVEVTCNNKYWHFVFMGLCIVNQCQ